MLKPASTDSPDLASVVSLSRSEGNFALAEILESYLHQAELGLAPAHSEVIAQHPDLEIPLRENLAKLDLLRRAAISLHDSQELASLAAVSVNSETVLGDFRIIRQIGQGGMGIVYEAEQTSLRRRVAIKILPLASMLDPRRLQRFQHEAQSAATLNHTNIVRVHAVGCDRGIHFYAMELIDGWSLAEIIDDLRRTKSSPDTKPNVNGKVADGGTTHALSSGELANSYSSDRPAFYRSVARLGSQAAEALDHAHSVGIIHRDIKPSNLMVDRAGELRITDFGLATTQGDPSVTLTGEIVGTLRYLSPEQASGSRDLVDHRTDIYSLAATLYELTTLEPVLTGDAREELLDELNHREPASPRRLDPRIPPDLETVLLKALAKEPRDRYATAADFSADLKRFIESRPITARRISRLERTRRWIARNRTVSALMTTIVLLLAMLAAGGFAVAWRRGIEAQRQKLLAYASDMKLAQSALNDGDFRTTERLLLDWVPTEANPTDHRHFEWYYLWTRSHRQAALHTLEHGVTTNVAAFSPDGSRLAVGSFWANIPIYDVGSGKKLSWLSAKHEETFALVTMPRSNRLVSGDMHGTVQAWDWQSLTSVQVFQVDVEDRTNSIRSIAVSPDEHYLAVAACPDASHSTEPSSVFIWDLNRQVVDKRIDGFSGTVLVHYSNDGRSLWTLCLDGVLKRWDSTTWELIDQRQLIVGRVTALGCAPDSTRLAVASIVEHESSDCVRLNVWDTSEWRLESSIQSFGSRINGLAFSHDGGLLGAGYLDGAIMLRDMSTEQAWVSRASHRNKVNQIVFSPDNRVFCSTSSDGSARIWRIDDFQNQSADAARTPRSEASVSGVGFSEEGAKTWSVDGAGHVRICDSRTGGAVRDFVVEPASSNTALSAISPDQRWLAIARGSWPVEDRTSRLEIHDAVTGKLQVAYDFERSYFLAQMAFSPDSTSIAVPGQESILVLDTRTSQTRAEIRPCGWKQGLAFSPDGRWLVGGGEGDGDECPLDIIDARTFELKMRMTVKEGVKRCNFSPDSRFLATVGNDYRIRLRETERFTTVQEFPACQDWLLSVEFSSDGRRIVTSGMDGKVRLWHTECGQELLTLALKHQNWCWSARMSTHGDAVVAADRDSAVVYRAEQYRQLERMSINELEKLRCR